jgi:glycosyltransferase involved in cell wall biosynthesis
VSLPAGVTVGEAPLVPSRTVQEAPATDAAPPLLSVVIPTLGRPTLDDQLTALAACRWGEPWEIVLADNGSDGEVARVCERWQGRGAPIRYVEASGRRGRSHAVNRGAEAARGRWLLLIDDDDLVEPDIVAEVGDAFLAGARAVVFNLNVREVNPPHVWRSNDQARATEDRRPMFRGIPAIWGCAGIERALFLELGGFDEDRPYAEDLDFSVRLHEQTGVEPVWVQRQLIHYRLRGGVRERFRQRVAVADTIQAIAVAHPDTIRPLPGDPLPRMVKGAVRALRLLPGCVRAEGRLACADAYGRLWGEYRAAKAHPWHA